MQTDRIVAYFNQQQALHGVAFQGSLFQLGVRRMTVLGMTVVAIAIAIVYANQKRRGLTFVTAVVLGLLGLVFQLALPFWFAIALIVFGCVESRLTVRYRNKCLLGCGVLAFGIVLMPSLNRVRTVWKLRQQTPYVSLIDRVAPHPDAPVLLINAKDDDQLQPEQSYVMQEDFGFRASAIRAIHQTAVHHFLVADDFGVGRMRYDPLWVAQDHGKLIDLHSPSDGHVVKFNLPGSVSSESNEASGVPLSPETITRINQAHRSYENWFLDSSRLGDVRDVNSVAGFLSHAMTTPNTTKESQISHAHAPLEYWDDDARETRRDFTLRKLQLVGLLYHDKPVAYELDTLPELMNAQTAPTRDLTKFETEALKQLVGGDPIHYRHSGDVLHMMGALRNVDSCRECHDGPENQLLGAFSYELLIHEPNRGDSVELESEALIASSDR